MKKYKLAEGIESLMGRESYVSCKSDDINSSLEICKRVAKQVGVTRLANLTLLDNLGISTWQAVRPLSRNLVVSQGKGATEALAQISTLAESIELYCAEDPTWDRWDCFENINSELTYDFLQLSGLLDSYLVFKELPRRWTKAYDLTKNKWTYLPTDLLRVDFSDAIDVSPSFHVTSNGLASGTTIEQAVLHGLLEVVERDAVRRAQLGQTTRARVNLKLDALTPTLKRQIEQIRAKNCFVEIYYIQSIVAIPVLEVRLIGEDGRIFSGTAAHCDVQVAMAAALCEAAQSRLTAISGARDDISDGVYKLTPLATRNRRAFIARRPVAKLNIDAHSIDNLETTGKVDAIQQCIRLLKAAKFDCLVADIGSVDPDFCVVFVVIPGMFRTLGGH